MKSYECEIMEISTEGYGVILHETRLVGADSIDEAIKIEKECEGLSDTLLEKESFGTYDANKNGNVSID